MAWPLVIPAAIEAAKYIIPAGIAAYGVSRYGKDIYDATTSSEEIDDRGFYEQFKKEQEARELIRNKVLQQITAIPAIDNKSKIIQKTVVIPEVLDNTQVFNKKKNKSEKPKNTASEESSSSQAEASVEAPVSEASTESATPQPQNDDPNTNQQGKLSRLQRTRKWLGNKIAGDQTPKQPKSPKTSKEFGIQDFLYRTSKNTPNWPTWGRQLWNIGVGTGAVSALHAGREYVIPYAVGVFTGNYPDNKSESKIVEEVKPPLKKDQNQVADSIDNVKKQQLLDMYRKQ